MKLSGERLALWWVDAITRTAPESGAAARREAIRADVFEQQAAGVAGGVATQQIQRAIGSRVLRGVPADLAWRLTAEFAPGRWRWHLRNTATVITVLMLVMLPVNFVADSVPARWPGLLSIYSAVWGFTFLFGWIQIGIAVAAIAARLVPGFLDGVPDVSTLPRLVRARRRVLTVMGVALAASAVGRLSDSDAFNTFSGGGWFVFVAVFPVFATLVVAGLLVRLLQFRKISS